MTIKEELDRAAEHLDKTLHTVYMLCDSLQTDMPVLRGLLTDIGIAVHQARTAIDQARRAAGAEVDPPGWMEHAHLSRAYLRRKP